MSQEPSSSRQCPQCGAALKRIPRLDADRDQDTRVHRYRCRGESCAWEGTLEVRAAAIATESAVIQVERTERRNRRALTRVWAWSAVGLACVAFAGAGLRLHGKLAPAAVLSQAEGSSVPFGVSDFGRPLSADDPLLANADGAGPMKVSSSAPAPASKPAREITDADSLDLREGCAWGNPGRNPYTGTVGQALRGARLPAEVVAAFEAKMRDGQATDRLEISNEGIRAIQGEEKWQPRAIKMTFGKTLCVNTRVNFKPGHVERADLYEVADAKGVTYSVMVPYVCGNVSVLGARAEQEDAVAPTEPAVLGATAQAPAPKASTPPPPGPRSVQGVQNIVRVGERNVVVGQNLPLPIAAALQNVIPEPGTLASMAAGLALLGAFVRRRTRRGGL